MERYSAIGEEVQIKREDNLNLHKLSISVLLRSEHYDLLYPQKYIEENPSLLTYDARPMHSFLNPPLENECVWCNLIGKNVEDFIELKCKDVFHKVCLAIQVEKMTNNLALLTKKEQEVFGSYKCPRCQDKFDATIVELLYDEKTRECYEHLRKIREKREIKPEPQKKEEEDVKRNYTPSESIPPFGINGSPTSSLKCEMCGKLIRSADKFLLECKHSYHSSCLKEYIQRETKGMIFLTEEEQKKISLSCKICSSIINEGNVELIFKDNETAVNFYKEERNGRDHSPKLKSKSKANAKPSSIANGNPKGEEEKVVIGEEAKDTICRLSCCNRDASIAVIRELMLDRNWMDFKGGKLVWTDCVLCQQTMKLKDVRTLLQKELDSLCLNSCAFCGKELSEHDNIADCLTHYKCKNCPLAKGCNICSLLNLVEDEGVLIKEMVSMQCSQCRKSCSLRNTTLLSCYHYFCSLCMTPPQSKGKGQGQGQSRNKGKNQVKRFKKKNKEGSTVTCPICKGTVERLAVRISGIKCVVLHLPGDDGI